MRHCQDSRPPPVSFSPPNAPPISAPLVPMLTLAIPQSLTRERSGMSPPRAFSRKNRGGQTLAGRRCATRRLAQDHRIRSGKESARTLRIAGAAFEEARYQRRFDEAAAQSASSPDDFAALFHRPTKGFLHALNGSSLIRGPTRVSGSRGDPIRTCLYADTSLVG